MIFSELYSAYYNAVAAILSQLLDGETDPKKLEHAVTEKAFGESVLTVLPSLKNEKWQLMRGDMTTPITHTPTMPLTHLQLRWLKALSLDPRIRLFDALPPLPEELEPLFTPDDFYIFDQYTDGDPYTDEGYIRRFRTVLSALHSHTPLRIRTANRRGGINEHRILPHRLEYSEKDDKLRLIATDQHGSYTVNLGRMIFCEPCPEWKPPRLEEPPRELRSLTLLVVDERNALERVMLHFAHFEKQAERIDDRQYRLHIRYDKADETEMVIRVLSFGPFVKVESPHSFVSLIRERLVRQKNCGI